MPREAGRPREIELPQPARRGVAPADATTIEKPTRPVRPAVARQQPEEDDSRKRGPGGVKVPRPAVKLNDDGRQRQKLTITNFDREAQVRSLASLKRKREKEKLKAMGIQQPREKIAREVIIPEAITIQELSNRMAERAVDLIKYLMQQGAMHKITDVVDADTAELIVQEFGHTPKRVSEADVEIGFVGDKDADDSTLGIPRTCRDDHGSRRPRQDVAARCDPFDERRIRRSRRHHAAHRRLSGHGAERRQDHVHRHAWPRSLHGDACPRRQGDGHRRARRRRR